MKTLLPLLLATGLLTTLPATACVKAEDVPSASPPPAAAPETNPTPPPKPANPAPAKPTRQLPPALLL
jgi:hypothetical protein